MSPSVHQARMMAQRDDTLVALVFLPNGDTYTFSEPVEFDSIIDHDSADAFYLAVVGLSAQMVYGLFRPHLER